MSNKEQWVTCSNCLAPVKQYIIPQFTEWPTVEEFEMVTGRKLDRNDLVWVVDLKDGPWEHYSYNETLDSDTRVVAIPGLGMPRSTWRPKESE